MGIVGNCWSSQSFEVVKQGIYNNSLEGRECQCGQEAVNQTRDQAMPRERTVLYLPVYGPTVYFVEILGEAVKKGTHGQSTQPVVQLTSRQT